MRYHLFAFAHAVAHRGGGGGSTSVPTTPPAYNPPDADSPALQTYLAGNNAGYYDEFVRNRDGSNGTDTRNFGSWLKDHLNASPEDALWQDESIAAYAKGGAFTPKAATTTTPPPVPPAPDAPVAGISAPAVTPPAPPVSDRSSEVMQAGRAARQSARKRKGFLSTLLAGETGGATGQVKTLLGQ